MKRWCVVIGLAVWVAAGSAVRAAEDVPAETVAKSLQQIAAETKAILVKDKIHDAFDWYRKMKEFGVTYQPRLAAPNDLVGRLDKEQLRLYAGVKLIDALYAVTFLKRQDVADCVRVMEQIDDALQLRSYADLNNHFLHTLKKAAERPEELDVQRLIDQLSSDYVSELPALLASVETADYLIDGLYGMVIEMSYITGSLWNAENAAQMQAGFNQFPTSGTISMLLSIFEAFDRMDENIRVSGKTEEKLAVLRKMYQLERGEQSGQLTDEEAEPGWIEAGSKIAEIRMSILTPSSD